ncbi:MAG: membrane protein insertase YidC [Gammaproteobacteria bacterium]|nr:membrane protein insertase YidC [Gammaproteobacteria bacterium]
MEQQRILLYVALSLVGLMLYNQWIMDYRTPEPVVTETTTVTNADGTTTVVEAPADLPAAAAGNAAAATATATSTEARSISVTTDIIDVQISTQGGTITHVQLIDYPVSIKDSETPFSLMSSDPAHFLVAESGLQSRKGVKAPTHREIMTSVQESYTMGESDTLDVPLTWEADGITVTKTLTFTRGSYEVVVNYDIQNTSDTDWVANQYRQLKRKPGTKDEKQQFLNTYIGAVVSTEEDRYSKVSFGDIEDENLDIDVTNGWVAMIQHYFASAWLPLPDETNKAYTLYLQNENRYVVGMVSGSQTIPAGSQGNFSTKAYIGPKIQEKLSAAAPHLELTVDYGWLTILAQPLFWVLKTLHGYLGNWGWAIIGTTFLIKAVFYKLSEAGYRSMARMKKLQPKLQSLKERHGDDRAKMGQATMELYKKEKVNPLGSCFPMLVQIPVFIALYWVLLESVELRQAPWLGWIKDLSIRDPFFILPFIMAATMYIQQKLNPAPVDPIQAKVFQFLPLVFGIFFAFFPAGLVLYWVVNNTLSIMQQYYITRLVLGDTPEKSKKATP